MLQINACLLIFLPIQYPLFLCLQDVVFKLWYKYLQVTGNAFTGSHDNTVPTKGSIFYYRHADLLGVNKRKQSGRRKRVDPSSDDHDGDNDDLELCSHFSDEEFYEGTK